MPEAATFRARSGPDRPRRESPSRPILRGAGTGKTRRRMTGAFSRFALLVAFAGPAPACELALALAVDVSGSVDRREFRLQMDGLAEALRDGVVSEALVRAEAAVTLVQWTGSSRQTVSIPWTRIRSFGDADGFADAVAAAPRAWRNYSTAIGEALRFGLAQFEAAPDCRRRVIDVSGDGPSNEGIEPGAVREDLRAAGVSVNALAIEESEADLTAYFWENVIVGEGAFVVTANRFADYPDRIRLKLRRETGEQLSCADAACESGRFGSAGTGEHPRTPPLAETARVISGHSMQAICSGSCPGTNHFVDHQF